MSQITCPECGRTGSPFLLNGVWAVLHFTTPMVCPMAEAWTPPSAPVTSSDTKILSTETTSPAVPTEPTVP
jgi:hypothetical protein